ncbi:MAG: hypothetical protein QM703_09285 [Gemmatales bacterium]
MHLVIGKTNYGCTDHLVGLCYVVTEFIHIFWIPVIPIESKIIMVGRAVPYEIPLSWHSIFLTYGRWLAPFVAILTTVLAFSDLSSKRQEAPINWTALTIAIACWAATIYSFLKNHILGTKPSPSRALELVKVLGLSSVILAEFYLDDPRIESLMHQPKDDPTDGVY